MNETQREAKAVIDRLIALHQEELAAADDAVKLKQAREEADHKHQAEVTAVATLLLRRLGLDKSHVGSGDGLADRFSIGGIILLSLDVGPDIGRSPDYLALRAALVILR
jgi:hypothetical protein